MLSQGQAFFTPESQETGVGRHLWVVLSDPSKHAKVVLANLSTLRSNNSHLGCTVGAGEHRSLSRPSVLRCDQARLAEATGLENLLTKRVVQATADADDSLVRKLQASLCKSPHTPNEVKELLRAQALCPAEA